MKNLKSKEELNICDKNIHLDFEFSSPRQRNGQTAKKKSLFRVFNFMSIRDLFSITGLSENVFRGK